MAARTVTADAGDQQRKGHATAVSRKTPSTSGKRRRRTATALSQEQLHKNRMAAQKNRDRKRTELQALEAELAQLQQSNNALRAQQQQFETNNRELRDKIQLITSTMFQVQQQEKNDRLAKSKTPTTVPVEAAANVTHEASSPLSSATPESESESAVLTNSLPSDIQSWMSLLMVLASVVTFIPQQAASAVMPLSNSTFSMAEQRERQEQDQEPERWATHSGSHPLLTSGPVKAASVVKTEEPGATFSRQTNPSHSSCRSQVSTQGHQSQHLPARHPPHPRRQPLTLEHHSPTSTSTSTSTSSASMASPPSSPLPTRVKLEEPLPMTSTPATLAPTTSSTQGSKTSTSTPSVADLQQASNPEQQMASLLKIIGSNPQSLQALPNMLLQQILSGLSSSMHSQIRSAASTLQRQTASATPVVCST